MEVISNPPTQFLVDSGVVLKFVQSLKAYNDNRLQHEAARALTNICSHEEHVATVISHAAVPILIDLLESSQADINVKEQAIWVLGNIISDSESNNRKMVLSLGALTKMLPFFFLNKLIQIYIY